MRRSKAPTRLAPDFQSQVNRVRSAELARKAASAERYPSVGAETDYGLSGVNPGSSHGTVDAAATLRIPIFQGGRVHADVLRADASLAEERQRLEDLRAKIDQEVRDAYLDLECDAQGSFCRKKRDNACNSNLGTISRSLPVRSHRQHRSGSSTRCAGSRQRCLHRKSLQLQLGQDISGESDRSRGIQILRVFERTLSMSEDPLQGTPPAPNVAADSAGAADPLTSAYPRRRSYKRWIFLASLVVLAVAGAFLWHYFSGFESTDDAQVDVHLYPVSARISGYIQKVNVEDNQWVNEGSTLVEIDPKDYEVALARAQAARDTSEAAAKGLSIDVPISSVDTSSQLKFASSDIKNAEAAIEAAEKQAAAAHARVLEAQAENVKAQDDVTRYRLLLTKAEVAKQVYDHAYAAAATDIAAIAAAEADEAAAQQAVQEAQSRLTEAEARYEDAQAGPQRVTSTRAKALSAMADVKQKEAAVEQAQLNLGYTKIPAPVDGEVTKKVVVGLNVDPGRTVTHGGSSGSGVDYRKF